MFASPFRSRELLGVVSTEGGPLLLGDRTSLGTWTGVFGDDYKRLSTMLDAAEPAAVEVRDRRIDALAWSVPTGTTDVWRVGQSSILLTRAWLEHPYGDSGPFAVPPLQSPFFLGRLRITSGWLVVMWATEDGADMIAVEPRDALALDLSVGHSALVVALSIGEYECWADEIHVGEEFAMRCLVHPVTPPP